MRSKSLAVILLSLLSEKPAHAYDLLKTLRIRQGKWRVQSNVGTVYRTVERLADLGLIAEIACSRQGNRPERTVYEITQDGRDSLETQVTELLSVDQAPFDAFRLGLAFIDDLDKDTAVELLEHRRQWLETRLTEVQDSLTALTNKGLPRKYFVVYELDFAQLSAEISWLEALVKDIKSDRLSWEDTVPPHFGPAGKNNK